MKALIDLRDIPQHSCKSICLHTYDDAFVFKLDDHTATCYQNRCPHKLSSLNWMPDTFLTLDQAHIICANHGALFQPLDGLCVFGPCLGQKLIRVPTVIRQGQMYLAE